MADELKGLLCGTSLEDPYLLGDTESEESDVDLASKRETNSSNLKSENITTTSTSSATCKVCTTLHALPNPVCCESCSNVLEPEKFPETKIWSCKAQGCAASDIGYVNFEDAGLCGLCGSKRSAFQ